MMKVKEIKPWLMGNSSINVVSLGKSQKPKAEATTKYKLISRMSETTLVNPLVAPPKKRAHKKRRLADIFGEREDSWKDEAKKAIEEIIEKLKIDKEKGGYPRIPTKGEAEVIAALERSVSKIPFDLTTF